MITLKYEKTGPAAYISHIDLLRGFARTLRRAGRLPAFSRGFNPHMLLFFSPPLALGISSLCEYVSLELSVPDPEEFVKEFNAASPPGIRATAAYITEKRPGLAAKICAADYLYASGTDLDLPGLCDKILKEKELVIEYAKKGETVRRDVRGMIGAAEPAGDGIVLRLPAGNESLRADRLLPALEEKYGFVSSPDGITKLRQYVTEDGGCLDASAYLREMEK